MKKLILTTLVLVLCHGLSAQTDRYKGAIILNNGTLKEVDDSIRFAIDIFIDELAIPARNGVRFVPVIVAGDNTLELPDLMVQGRGKNRSWSRSKKLLTDRETARFKDSYQMVTLRKGENTDFHYTYVAPYQIWMDEARLIVYQEFIDYRDKRGIIAMSFDNKVQLSPRTPYTAQPQANFVTPAAEKKLRNRQGQAYLDFQVGRSEILPNFRRNPQELAKIGDAFNEITSNPDVTINGLFIEGYASPEGRYESNDRLSHQRANALKSHITEHFNLPLTPSQIKVSWVAEDWQGFKMQLQAADIGSKDQILAIIDGDDQPDAKEKQIARLAGGAPYRQIMKDIFPILRRVEYQVDYAVRDFGTDEIATKYKANYKLLSQRELFMVAQSGSEEIDSHDILLNAIPSLYPDNVTAAVNAAAVLINTGNYRQAIKMLDRFQEHEETWNNLGAAYMMDGDLDQAEKMFKKAREAGVEQAEHNIEEISAKRADNARMERYKNRTQ